MSEIYAVDTSYSDSVLNVLEMKAQGLDLQAASGGGDFKRNDNVAMIRVSGLMVKGFGIDGFATNTVDIKNKLRAAAKNESIAGIMMIIDDSPGGHVSGLSSLIDTVRTVRKKKPIYAAVDDLAGSAAYWLASQADTVSVNRTGAVGSIGVFTVLHDTSGAFEKEGVKTHLISSGDVKGSGPGVPITDEYLSGVQEQVDFHAANFIKEVAEGRGIPVEAVEKVATGAVFTPAKAKKLGLIDTIADVETALSNFKATLASPDRGARIRRKLALTKHRRKSV